jgi:hypothetical protein
MILNVDLTPSSHGIIWCDPVSFFHLEGPKVRKSWLCSSSWKLSKVEWNHFLYSLRRMLNPKGPARHSDFLFYLGDPHNQYISRHESQASNQFEHGKFCYKFCLNFIRQCKKIANLCHTIELVVCIEKAITVISIFLPKILQTWSEQCDWVYHILSRDVIEDRNTILILQCRGCRSWCWWPGSLNVERNNTCIAYLMLPSVWFLAQVWSWMG